MVASRDITPTHSLTYHC